MLTVRFDMGVFCFRAVENLLIELRLMRIKNRASETSWESRLSPTQMRNSGKFSVKNEYSTFYSNITLLKNRLIAASSMSWWGVMRRVDADDAIAVPLITCCVINCVNSSDAAAVHFGSWRTQIDRTDGCDDILIKSSFLNLDFVVLYALRICSLYTCDCHM